MTREIRVARPGVVLRKGVARKPKHCAACGCLIMPGEVGKIKSIAKAT